MFVLSLKKIISAHRLRSPDLLTDARFRFCSNASENTGVSRNFD